MEVISATAEKNIGLTEPLGRSTSGRLRWRRGSLWSFSDSKLGPGQLEPEHKASRLAECLVLAKVEALTLGKVHLAAHKHQSWRGQGGEVRGHGMSFRSCRSWRGPASMPCGQLFSVACRAIFSIRMRLHQPHRPA